jgi:xanthine dehydrogenase YagS FAD-binding subunit
MKSFEYVQAETLESAARLLGPDRNVSILAGGTDLITQMKSGFTETARLVSLKNIPGLDAVIFDKGRSLRLGILATLDNIYQNPEIAGTYPVLAQAIIQSASPQLRNRGTIGGNLNQASRCWYYRGEFHCWLKGGNTCYARDGENQHHAIFGGGPCYTVHPSDPAVALVALDAEVRLAGLFGERSMSLEDYFVLPDLHNRRLTKLGPGEILGEIRVPAAPETSRSVYLKAMERRVWSFALASVAVHVTFSDDKISRARIVLGGVAPKPWRLAAVENTLLNQSLDDKTIEEAAGLSVAGAVPLEKNNYKIPLVKGLIREALEKIRKTSPFLSH